MKHGIGIGPDFGRGGNRPRANELMVKTVAATNERFRDINGQSIILKES